ncbi:Pectinesterase inhibitor domain-containing protein [Hirschfeldia incana]|nr:Pectinesterase inhibitor domain-containing protein [Hirschfeldia incana]
MKFFVLVVIIFLFLNCFATAQTLIRDSCKTAAAKDPNLKYDFCVQSLEADPQSKSATSLTGLVLASTNNAASKTTNVKGIVETILKNKKYPPGTEPALRTCVKLYDDANNSLNKALMNVKSCDYRSASVHLSAALDDPGTCEDGFKEKHGISPVTNENKVLFQKILIPLSFTNML